MIQVSYGASLRAAFPLSLPGNGKRAGYGETAGSEPALRFKWRAWFAGRLPLKAFHAIFNGFPATGNLHYRLTHPAGPVNVQAPPSTACIKPIKI